jgi:transglutaminase-like putative cysteine protease
VLLNVEHHFAFEYADYISESFLEVRVQPKTTADQTVHGFVLAVGPPTRVSRFRDWNDNLVHHFNINRFHRKIEVLSRSVVSTHPGGQALETVADTLPLAEIPYTLHDFLQFGGPVRLTPLLRRFHRAVARPAGPRLGEAVAALGAHLHQGFSYQKEVTRYDSTTEDFLKIGAGVCQDFAHLMLAMLRLSGIPCRYVSGYLHVDSPRAEPAQSHAWIEFHAPAHGWVPFDPTHNRAPDARYVVVGHGRHYADVPPNKGIYRGNARETLHAEVKTRVTTLETSSALQEGVETIDLPVLKEAPARQRDYDIIAAEAAGQQQQQ